MDSKTESQDLKPVHSGKPDGERGGYRRAFACAPEQAGNTFVATEEWQEIQPGQDIPAGLKINLDITTGKRYGKLIPKGVKIVEDLAYIRGQLEAGVNVDAFNEEQSTLLQRAAQKGDLECVKYLCVDATPRANVNLLGKRFTALQLAVMRGHADVVKFLVETAKSDLSIMSKSGNLPVHLAANAGNLELVKFFFSRKKAKVNVVTRDGETCLHLAGVQGHLEVIKYLVKEKNADVELKNKDGKLAAECCDDYEQEEAANYLRSVLSDRAMDCLLGDLGLEEKSASKKNKKNKNKTKKTENKAESATNGSAETPASGSSKKSKKNKNKNKKKNKKKNDNNNEPESESSPAPVGTGSGLAVVENPISFGGGGGGGSGLAVVDNQPIRARQAPVRDHAAAARAARAAAEAAEASEEESESDVDLDADLD